MEYAEVGTQAMTALILGAAVSVILPIAVALIWKFAKKEPFSSILVGAVTFLLVALILEKLIQNALLFPTQMGLKEHAISRFVGARPYLLALIAGLFPGVFEETGRLVAFKTVLKNRKNRETSVSYGIGHGGLEAILLLGATYVTYLAYAAMINSGTFGTVVEQVAAQSPDKVDALNALAGQISELTVAGVGAGLAERLFAFLFHIGASILVFYACRDKKRFWLYPLAIMLHTVMDFVGAQYVLGVNDVSVWTVEAVAAAIGLLTFLGAYFLLCRKDKASRVPDADIEA